MRDERNAHKSFGGKVRRDYLGDYEHGIHKMEILE
jgi:hypothetical protein